MEINIKTPEEVRQVAKDNLAESIEEALALVKKVNEKLIPAYSTVKKGDEFYLFNCAKPVDDIMEYCVTLFAAKGWRIWYDRSVYNGSVMAQATKTDF